MFPRKEKIVLNPLLNIEYYYSVDISNFNWMAGKRKSVLSSYILGVNFLKKVDNDRFTVRIRKEKMKYIGIDKELEYLCKITDEIFNPIEYKIDNEGEVRSISNLKELEEKISFLELALCYSELSEKIKSKYLKGIKMALTSPRSLGDYFLDRDLSKIYFLPFYNNEFSTNEIKRIKKKLKDIGGIDYSLNLNIVIDNINVGEDFIKLRITGDLDTVYFDNEKIKRNLEKIYDEKIEKIFVDIKYLQEIEFSLKFGIILKNKIDFNIRILDDWKILYQNDYFVNLKKQEN